ncbi:hypothetical protein [Falsirhodobacter sp. 20TX0035]|uniref:hypothetical protein n=1 Tax=Falsirhodobacter sp. 20TX0035 TaxID=3022019 RepID=UPI002330A6A1|nr:hypothetical protein [Falsirhodobacter sp. 20TX0035]MDB6453937.1 hypothetical protein [Falsirhodobacter sp. 20TX0035]
MPFTRKKHVCEMDEAIARAGRDARRHASDAADRLRQRARRSAARVKDDLPPKKAETYLDEARDFTRRHPLSVVAGALVTGAVLATALRRGK